MAFKKRLKKSIASLSNYMLQRKQALEYQHKLSFLSLIRIWVLSQELSFATIWVEFNDNFSFCCNFSFVVLWVWSQFEFLNFVIIWVFELSQFELSRFKFLSFLTIQFFYFCHIPLITVTYFNNRHISIIAATYL